MNLDSEVAVILAAGKGTRMRSPLPKVLTGLCGVPMVEWVVNAVRKAGIHRVVVVVGHKKDEVVGVLEGLGVDCVEQSQQLGTGNALKVACAFLEGRSESGGIAEDVIVLPGDSPLIRPETLNALRETHRRTGSDATLVTAYLDDPKGYGRIVRDERGGVSGIVEELDATEGEREIKEINSGIYCFRSSPLREAIERLTPDNKKGEYYLTQVVAILSGQGKRVSAFAVSDPNEVLGVNSQEDLEKVTKIAAEGGA
ncbi:MAG: NTP transferase domain-containing protein [Planctomycetes bacterium]|nr:NTP transferase domain-containing protein [Planctomycetota bacterium]